MYLYVGCLFFFKQKTAYEMRISDWSSDVCSSDLRNILLGDQLRRVEHVIGLLGRPTLIEDLNPQIPLRIIARGNRLEQVASVEIGVGPRDLHRLVPRRGRDAQHRLQNGRAHV